MCEAPIVISLDDDDDGVDGTIDRIIEPYFELDVEGVPKVVLDKRVHSKLYHSPLAMRHGMDLSQFTSRGMDRWHARRGH